jgi:hypothetical protein
MRRGAKANIGLKNRSVLIRVLFFAENGMILGMNMSHEIIKESTYARIVSGISKNKSGLKVTLILNI